MVNEVIAEHTFIGKETCTFSFAETAIEESLSSGEMAAKMLKNNQGLGQGAGSKMKDMFKVRLIISLLYLTLLKMDEFHI